MKKIFLTIATAGLLVTSAYADGGKKTDKTTTVSYTVENQFDSTFGNAKNVVWAVTSNFQKATFTQDDVQMTAFYDLQGNYLGITQDVDYSTLDAKAKATIADKYKGYGVKEVIKFDNTDAQNFEQTTYFVDLKGAGDEILVRVAPDSNVYFFKEVK
jgi:hypothetical protein